MTPAVRALLLPLLVLFLSLPGCFSEQNFPPDFSRLVHLPNTDHLTTRAWAARIHQAAKPLLPRGRDEAITTDDLSIGTDPAGAAIPINLWQHFNLHPDELDNPFLNLRALEQTAQTVSPTPTFSNGRIQRPEWNGFHEIELPVNGVTLYARLGTPDKQTEIPGSWVIFTHGLFGSLDGKDVINHVQALRRAGHHVLAVEMRGHGQTHFSHPEYAITFGLEESGDLLAAARWLKAAHGATRVGLVCFSLTGVEALLTAWLDGRTPVTDLRDLPLHTLLPPHEAQPAFNAGMFVVSAPVGLMEVAGRFETHYSLLDAPTKATFQNHVTQRLAYYKFGPGYSMWDLVRYEFVRSPLNQLYPSFNAARPDMQTFLDLSRDNWKSGAARMENIRVPVLLLNAANDPLGCAQGVANLFARQHNPNIGVILTKEGGHIGYSAYNVDYYFSLMLNFFDPATAPVAQ